MQGFSNRRIVVLSGLLTILVLAAIVLPIALHQRRVQQMSAGAPAVSSPTVTVRPASTVSPDIRADRDEDERRPERDRRREHRERREHRHDADED